MWRARKSEMSKKLLKDCNLLGGKHHLYLTCHPAGHQKPENISGQDVLLQLITWEETPTLELMGDKLGVFQQVNKVIYYVSPNL